MPKASKFSPDEGLTIYDLKDSEAVHYGEQSKGYVGKNLLKISNTTKTVNNVTFTINNDGSVLVNGTASANIFFNLIQGQAAYNDDVDYILTGCPSGGSGSTYALRWNTGTSTPTDTGSGVTIPAGTGDALYIEIKIQSGYVCNNLLFKPMLCLASIPDSTYEPYLTPNTEIDNKLSYADNTILGAKNLIRYPFPTGSVSYNGITFTDNGDGTITVSGTATAAASFALIKPTSQLLKEGIYILSDENGYRDGNVKGVYTCIERKKGASGTSNYDIDTSKTGTHSYAFNVDYSQYDYFSAALYVPNGTVLNNPITLKPMIRLASDTDDTYTLYAMTNRELTVNMLKSIFSPIQLHNTDDLDDFYGSLDKAGVYQWAGSVPAHAPTFGGDSGATYCTLFVFPAGDASGAWTHICIQGGWRNLSKHIAIRGYGGSPASMSAWRYVTDATT